VFVAKAVTGTYTFRAKATSAKGTPRSCESTVVVPGAESVTASTGSPTRVRQAAPQLRDSRARPAVGTIEPGFCDPMIGVKAGPLFYFSDGKASFAPAAGIAFMFAASVMNTKARTSTTTPIRCCSKAW